MFSNCTTQRPLVLVAELRGILSTYPPTRFPYISSNVWGLKTESRTVDYLLLNATLPRAEDGQR
jgi:hypothetical protein